jgi:hypothetical protein
MTYFERTNFSHPYKGLNQLIGKLWMDSSARKSIFCTGYFFKNVIIMCITIYFWSVFFIS